MLFQPYPKRKRVTECCIGGLQEHASMARKALAGGCRATSVLRFEDNHRRVVDFECRSKRDYEMWTQGVSRLLSIASEAKIKMDAGVDLKSCSEDLNH
ncbi:hypothetical protein ACET3Z_019292 [Daucus carota]